MVESVTVTQLADLMKSATIDLIDVREDFEYNADHIESAVNLPLSQFDQWAPTLDHDRHYYIICRSGRRSLEACERLKWQENLAATNVEGGMIEWRGTIG